jgi:hypothetical protein
MWSSGRHEGDCNGSDYFFLCEEAQRLVSPVPMSGQHKLWHIGKSAASTAIHGLLPCNPMPINFVGHREASRVGLHVASHARSEDALATNALTLSLGPLDEDAEMALAMALSIQCRDEKLAEPGPLCKRGKAIKKKLNEIAKLQSKLDSGEALETAQLEKIAKKDELEAESKALSLSL